MVTLQVNGKKMQVDVHPETPLLWVLREHLDLMGTKYGITHSNLINLRRICP